MLAILNPSTEKLKILKPTPSKILLALALFLALQIADLFVLEVGSGLGFPFKFFQLGLLGLSAEYIGYHWLILNLLFAYLLSVFALHSKKGLLVAAGLLLATLVVINQYHKPSGQLNSIINSQFTTEDSLFEIYGDGTAYVVGEVEAHVLECAFDGTCYFKLIINGEEIHVVYTYGDSPCSNSQALQAQNIEPKEWIKAFGVYDKFGKVHEIYTCESNDYFIRQDTDPTPLGPVTERFFDEVAERKASIYGSDKCSSQTPDPNGYLEKICQYIKTNNINTSPGDPARYKIKSVTEGQYKGQDVFIVNLDCCYLGDRAFIDKQTKAVVGFSVGPK